MNVTDLPELPESAVDEVLCKLNAAAQEFSIHEYGLPFYQANDGEPLEDFYEEKPALATMRAIVRAYGTECSRVATERADAHQEAMQTAWAAHLECRGVEPTLAAKIVTETCEKLRAAAIRADLPPAKKE